MAQISTNNDKNQHCPVEKKLSPHAGDEIKTKKKVNKMKHDYVTEGPKYEGEKKNEKITNKNDYESIPPGIKKRIKCHYLLFLQKKRKKSETNGRNCSIFIIINAKRPQFFSVFHAYYLLLLFFHCNDKNVTIYFIIITFFWFKKILSSPFSSFCFFFQSMVKNIIVSFTNIVSVVSCFLNKFLDFSFISAYF